MRGDAFLARVLLIPLVSAALLLPHPSAQAEGGEGTFQATITGQGLLTTCGTNIYCISDQGTGRVSGLGAATMIANETETLIDAASPCGFQVQGTATFTGTGNNTLSVRFTLHTCGFGTDDGATLVKPGIFTVTGGTGRFANATGSGSMYKIGILSGPNAVFQLRGTVSGSSLQFGDQGAPLPLGGAGCIFSGDGIHCLVLTTNTVTPYTALQCGTTAVSGRYVIKDVYSLSFDPTGLAIHWLDAQAAPGSLSNPVSGKSVQFLLTEAQDRHFATPGNFESATTVFVGPGLLFPGHPIPAVPPAKITYDGNGRITVTEPTVLTRLCTAVS
jgi:hypothetical protein